MSMYGYVVFYNTVQPTDPRARLLKLLEATGVESIFGAWRTVREDRTWDFIQKNLRATEDEVFEQPINGLNARGMGVREATSLYEEGHYLRVDVGPSEKRFSSRVWLAVRDGIPDEIRGSFAPGAMYIGLGYHDLTECTVEDEDRYIARAFFSVEFFGYGVPHDWRETNRLIFALPKIVEVKQELEAILGPLEGYAHWSV